MSVIAVVGAQWGDEGKGRVVDYLAADADLVVRYGGGNNAGHTVVNPHGHFKLHLIPSGIFYPATRNLLGNGVVINPPALVAELDGLAAAGFDCRNLFISDRAHLVMPYHVLLDQLEERERGERASWGPPAAASVRPTSTRSRGGASGSSTSWRPMRSASGCRSALAARPARSWSGYFGAAARRTRCAS